MSEILIDLVGEDNNLTQITYNEASTLLTKGEASLLLTSPPTLKLLPKQPSIPKRRHASRRSNLYGNISVLSPESILMFRCRSTKALWYLCRNLVTVVSSDPPTLQFTFVPNGLGHHGDPYYLNIRENKCVVCGDEQHLTKHHVVPRVFRRHLPEDYRNHDEHDIVLLCVNCHEKYEKLADQLKVNLCKECNITMNSEDNCAEFVKVTKILNTLKKHGDKIPEEKKQQLIKLVEESGIHNLKKPITDTRWGKLLVDQFDTYSFIKRWRQHFVDSMNPQFLPQGWNPDYRSPRTINRSPPSGSTINLLEST